MRLYAILRLHNLGEHASIEPGLFKTLKDAEREVKTLQKDEENQDFDFFVEVVYLD